MHLCHTNLITYYLWCFASSTCCFASGTIYLTTYLHLFIIACFFCNFCNLLYVVLVRIWIAVKCFDGASSTAFSAAVQFKLRRCEMKARCFWFNVAEKYYAAAATAAEKNIDVSALFRKRWILAGTIAYSSSIA